ncbi:hypothetical protein, partial [Klebsiella pneumoniae]|uniref:phage nozzle protein n=1 Tax=Klebsiella pneumoniae TaxID=573 RepID=UPI0025A19BAE
MFTKDSVDFHDEPYRIYLDNKTQYVIPAGAYNDDIYKTRVHLWDVYKMGYQKGNISIVEMDGRVETFEEPPEGWYVSPELYLNGNKEGARIFIGFNINFRYVFSKFLIKKAADDGSTATEDIGRLQLRRAWLNYENSGAFDIEVENTSRLFSYSMSGARLGSNALRVGALNLGTGQFRFPVAGNAQLNIVRIISDHTTPL